MMKPSALPLCPAKSIPVNVEDEDFFFTVSEEQFSTEKRKLLEFLNADAQDSNEQKRKRPKRQSKHKIVAITNTEKPVIESVSEVLDKEFKDTVKDNISCTSFQDGINFDCLTDFLADSYVEDFLQDIFQMENDKDGRG